MGPCHTDTVALYCSLLSTQSNFIGTGSDKSDNNNTAETYYYCWDYELFNTKGIQQEKSYTPRGSYVGTPALPFPAASTTCGAFALASSTTGVFAFVLAPFIPLLSVVHNAQKLAPVVRSGSVATGHLVPKNMSCTVSDPGTRDPQLQRSSAKREAPENCTQLGVGKTFCKCVRVLADSRE